MKAETRRVTGFVLKQTQLGEVDVLYTLLTLELGKIRVLVRGAKRLQSKLQYGLQIFIVTQITLQRKSSSSIPVVSSVNPLEQYGSIMNTLCLSRSWFIAAELLLKALPDEAENMLVYKHSLNFLRLLGRPNMLQDESVQQRYAEICVLQFFLLILQDLGLGLQLHNMVITETAAYILQREHAQFVSSMQLSALSGNQVMLLQELLSAEQNPKSIILFLERFSNIDFSSIQLVLNDFAQYQLERHLQAGSVHF